MKFNFNIILIGAGDSSVEIVDYIINDTNFNIDQHFIKIFDDNFKNLKYFKKLSNKIKLEKIINFKKFKSSNTKALITFGDVELRDKYKKSLKKKNIQLFKFVHSSSSVSKTSKIGLGSVICPMCVIGSYAIIKENVYINSGSLIGHHSIIQNSSVVSPNCFFGGNSKIGKNTFFGASSVLYPRKKVMNQCKISAGSVITKNIPSNSFVYGNPANFVKNK